MLQASLEEAEGQVRQYKERSAEAEKHLAVVESRNEQLQSLWFNKKRATWVASVIQRHYKAWRLRKRTEQSQDDGNVRPFYHTTSNENTVQRLLT